jgi:hypothetical protein
MKLRWLVILIIIVLLAILYAFLVNFRNSKIDTLPKVSKSVSESRAEGAFVALYNVVSIDDSLEEYLKKEELNHIDLKSMDFWVERKYHYYHKYIFFKKYVYRDELRLIIEDPTSLLRENGGFPFIGFKLKKTKTYSGSNGMGGEVCVLDIGNSLSKHLELEVYLNTSNEKEDLYIGNIKIELVD